MKKKIFLIVILAMVLCYVPTVFAANVQGCASALPGVVIDIKLPNIVHMVILGIQIVVPIILVIAGSIDLVKGLTAQKEDEIKKGQQIFVKRLITAALVFFVIAIVKLVIGFAAGDEGAGVIDCANCFLNGVDTQTGVCK